MLKDFSGVQDVFCGPTTVVHMKKGSAPLEAKALEEALTELKVAVESISQEEQGVL